MQSVYNSLLRALGCLATLMPIWANGIPSTTITGRIEERDFIAQNGRRIRISSMGNLVSFQSAGGAEHINVKRSREGYVLAYRLDASESMRVIHDVHDSYSQIISSGQRDFVPESFTFPSVNSGIPSDTCLTASATVRTSDGVIRLTHVFGWRAGYGPVGINMILTNISLKPLILAGVKRLVDNDTAQEYPNDFVKKGDGAVSFAPRCMTTNDCPPPCRFDDPECDPTRQGTPVFFMRGSPPPAYVSVKSHYDNIELNSIGLTSSYDLPGYRIDEDNQIVIGWSVNATLQSQKTRMVTIIEGM